MAEKDKPKEIVEGDEVVSEERPVEKAAKKEKKAKKAEAKKAEVVQDKTAEKDDGREALIAAIRESVREEVQKVTVKELRKARRRLKWNNFWRDLVIIAFAVVAVYFGYCLYSIRYFSFLKTECEKNGNCEVSSEEPEAVAPINSAGPVKDATWYLANYRYLFDELQVDLDADEVDAYYLYSGDLKAEEIRPEYLLAMAYNKVKTDEVDSSREIRVKTSTLKEAFERTFGTEVEFVERDFRQGCLEFEFDKTANEFVAQKETCTKSQKREVVEEIEKIYEEGEVIYVATTAAIYDRREQAFYRFDNLFRPAVSLVKSGTIGQYREQLNRYQYQFKKTDDGYRFAGVVKLR